MGFEILLLKCVDECDEMRESALNSIPPHIHMISKTYTQLDALSSHTTLFIKYMRCDEPTEKYFECGFERIGFEWIQHIAWDDDV